MNDLFLEDNARWDSDEVEIESNRLGIIRFRIGSEDFGAELVHVREILNVELTTVTPLYRVPNFVIGVLNLRGQIKPVIDLGIFLGLAGTAGRPHDTIRPTPAVVLADERRELIGLIDKIEKVEWILPSDLRDVSEMVEEGLRHHVTATVQTGGKPFSILNAPAILNSSTWNAFQA